jgi:hypothetical protein
VAEEEERAGLLAALGALACAGLSWGTKWVGSVVGIERRVLLRKGRDVTYCCLKVVVGGKVDAVAQAAAKAAAGDELGLGEGGGHDVGACGF